MVTLLMATWCMIDFQSQSWKRSARCLTLSIQTAFESQALPSLLGKPALDYLCLSGKWWPFWWPPDRCLYSIDSISQLCYWSLARALSTHDDVPGKPETTGCRQCRLNSVLGRMPFSDLIASSLLWPTGSTKTSPQPGKHLEHWSPLMCTTAMLLPAQWNFCCTWPHGRLEQKQRTMTRQKRRAMSSIELALQVHSLKDAKISSSKVW